MWRAGRTHTLRVTLVRQMTRRPREDGFLFLSKRFPMATRFFHIGGIFLDVVDKRIPLFYPKRDAGKKKKKQGREPGNELFP